MAFKERVFSGVQPTSSWLLREDLLRSLNDVGYAAVTVLDDRIERNGPRLTLIARRTVACEEHRAAIDDADNWRVRALEVEAQLAAARQAA